MDLQKILMGVLGKTLNKPDGEIAELLKEADGKTEDTIIKELLGLDKARISVVTEENKKVGFQDGIKKAKKEILSELETSIKTKYGIESEKTGEELIDEIIAEKGKPATGEAIKPEDIMRTQTYQDLLKTSKEQKKVAEDEIKTLKATHAREKATVIVGEKAMKTLAEFNPIVSDSAEIANNIQNLFISQLATKYTFGENGEILNASDGKLAIDGHGNPKKWEDVVKSEAGLFYQFKANNGGGNAGNEGGNAGAGGGNAGGAYPAGVQKPKTIEELSKLLEDDNIKSEDKVVISETYNKEYGG